MSPHRYLICAKTEQSSTTEYPITNYRGDILSNFEYYIDYYDAYGNERRETISDNPFGYCGEKISRNVGCIIVLLS